MKALLQDIFQRAIRSAEREFTDRGMTAEVHAQEGSSFVVQIRIKDRPTRFYTVKITENM